jgi:ubiquinone/menaquinone biosynthesis C-methylase UbiE
MKSDVEILRERYEGIANSGDENTTACDYNLRDLEIAFALQYIRDGDRVLDVGCGPGVALRTYASERTIKAHGIDYAENMVTFAQKRTREIAPGLKIAYQQANVLELPFANNHFDVVTSSRCLMALLDWDLQKEALLEIHRTLKPNAKLVLMEGTFDGLERLNHYRRQFGLSEIEADGRDRLYTRKFRERELLAFCDPHYALERTQRFGMYYFLTRIVQPLLVAPAAPRYDHALNTVAKQIAMVSPDFDGMGHLVAFVLRKRPALAGC